MAVAALARTAAPPAPPVPLAEAERAASGEDLVRVAAALTRDLQRARPAIYWADLLLTAAVGYGALALAATAGAPALRLLAGVVAVLALYRGVSFIHEVTHLKPGAAPGFHTAWNLLIGAPLLVPSFLYEGVHPLHHARTRYGTREDPEYFPPALLRPGPLALATAASALAPVALLLRFAVLAPVSAVVPGLRRWLVERGSALCVNPDFRRRTPGPALARSWRVWETATSLWALALLAAGVVAPGAVLTFLAVASAVAVLNQVRTLAAHLWEGEGEAVGVTAQFLDSVDVPPPALLPVLWAPVGLRYHALHHLLPGLPYHALGEAHRRLRAALPPASDFHRAQHRGLSALVVRLFTADRSRSAA